MNGRSVVSEKGQVTIPKPLRERLGIRPGEAVEFREDHGRLIVEKAPARDALDELYGVIDLGRGTDAFVAELRGEGRKP
jgi:antitoxin PrlF